MNTGKIALGSKCGSIIIYSLEFNVEKIVEFPRERNSPCSGIHGLKLNPCKTLVASAGTNSNSNSIGIFDAERLEPLCSSSEIHSDSVFSVCWISNSQVISVCRNGSLCLSSVKDDQFQLDFKQEFAHGLSSDKSNRVRDCDVFSSTSQHKIVTLSPVAKEKQVKLWDVTPASIEATSSFGFESQAEYFLSTAVATRDENVFGLGVGRRINLYDNRNSSLIQSLDSMDHEDGGVRSMSLCGNYITCGGEAGIIYSYDLRFPTAVVKSRKAPSAILTHCWDDTQSSLLLGGGSIRLSNRETFATILC